MHVREIEVSKSVAREKSRFEHGTYARYVRGCRCEDCRAACRVVRKRDKARWTRAARALPPAEPLPPVMRASGRSSGPLCPGIPGQPCVNQRSVTKRAVNNRCEECQRRAAFNGPVDAAPVRRRLRALSRRGIGYKQVAEWTGIGKTALVDVARGAKKRMRADNVRAVLELQLDLADVADGSRLPAGPTVRQLEDLVKLFGSKTAVARALGYKAKNGCPPLQIVPKGAKVVRAFNAKKVDALWQEWFS